MQRVAVVTGANRGLGFAISEALATLAKLRGSSSAMSFFDRCG